MSPSRTVFTKTHGRDFSHQNSTRLRCTAFSRFLKATANTRAHSTLSAAPFPGGRRHAHPSRHAPLVPLAPHAPRAPRPAGGKPPSLALEAASPQRAKTEGELPRCRGAPSTAPRRSPARRRFRVRRASCPPRPRGQAGVTGSHTWTRFHTVAVVATTASPAGEPAAGSRPRTPRPGAKAGNAAGASCVSGQRGLHKVSSKSGLLLFVDCDDCRWPT